MKSRGNRSASFVAAGTAALRRYHATRHLRPACGAARKRDGQPCEQVPLGNGRCRFHGGRTPSAERWHRTQWPDGGSANVEQKLARKLANVDRAAKQRAARLAAMTPDERAAHDAWHRARKPGAPAERAQRRRDRAEAAQARERMSAPATARPPSAELDSLQAEIRTIEQALCSLAAARPIGVFA